jgi:hypothetical protein
MPCEVRKKYKMPHPDKPELNIDPPEAERFVVSLRSVFSI